MLLSFDAAIERITGASAVIPPAVLAVITHYRSGGAQKQIYQLLLFHFNSFQGGVAQYYSHVHIVRINFLGDNTLIISTI